MKAEGSEAVSRGGAERNAVIYASGGSVDKPDAAARRGLIDAQTLRRLCVPSNWAGAVQTASHVGVVGATGILLWRSWGTWWALPVFMVHGTLSFQGRVAARGQGRFIHSVCGHPHVQRKIIEQLVDRTPGGAAHCALDRVAHRARIESLNRAQLDQRLRKVALQRQMQRKPLIKR